MTLAVRIQRETRALDGGAQTRRRERILQRAPAACVHVHVARRDERQAELTPQGLERGEPAAILPAREQLDRDPQPVGKEACQPAAIRRAGRLAGQPQRETVVERVRRLVGGCTRRGRQVVARETVTALGCRASRPR